MKKKKKFITLTCEPQNSLSKTTFSPKRCLRLTQVKIIKKNLSIQFIIVKRKKILKRKIEFFLRNFYVTILSRVAKSHLIKSLTTIFHLLYGQICYFIIILLYFII